MTASSVGITPSSANATAIRTDARFERCTRTASKAQSAATRGVVCTDKYDEAIAGCAVVVLCCRADHLANQVTRSLKGLLAPDTLILTCVQGLGVRRQAQLVGVSTEQVILIEAPSETTIDRVLEESVLAAKQAGGDNGAGEADGQGGCGGGDRRVGAEVGGGASNGGENAIETVPSADVESKGGCGEGKGQPGRLEPQGLEHVQRVEPPGEAVRAGEGRGRVDRHAESGENGHAGVAGEGRREDRGGVRGKL